MHSVVLTEAQFYWSRHIHGPWTDVFKLIWSGVSSEDDGGVNVGSVISQCSKRVFVLFFVFFGSNAVVF